MAPQSKKPGSRKAPQAPDDDDLIGTTEEKDEPVNMDIADVWAGVSSHWLHQVFGGDRAVVKKKLAEGGCEVIGRSKGSPLYRLKDAAAFLVPPKVDIEAYMQRLRPNDLPPMLQAAFWDGKLKHQKWAENAGDLWRTDDVLAVFGDLAFSFKTTASLWVEEVDRATGLTAEQRALIGQLTDKLLDSVYQLMIEAPKRSQTSSSTVEPLEEEVESDAV
jgi:hypothetical protein